MVSPAAWPRLGSELRPWTPRIAPDLVSASVRRSHSGSYRAAVVPLIADRRLRCPRRFVALAEEASAEIARFDAELGAEVAPFASVLLRSESASSSMIENLTSGAKAIALAELGSTEKRNATEIVGNVAAMTRRARPGRPARRRRDPGDARRAARSTCTQTSPAGGARSRSGSAGRRSGRIRPTFVPPHHEHVPELIDDLVAFMGRTTCRCWRRPRSPMRSSRRSTRSPTATGEPVAR